MVWTSNINDMALNLVYSLNTVHMKHLYTVSPFESHLNFESFSSHSLQFKWHTVFNIFPCVFRGRKSCCFEM